MWKTKASGESGVDDGWRGAGDARKSMSNDENMKIILRQI